MASLIDLFYKQEELARAEEQKTDAILDGKKDSEQTETVSTTTKSQEEFIEETVTKCMYYVYFCAYIYIYIPNATRMLYDILIIVHNIQFATLQKTSQF